MKIQIISDKQNELMQRRELDVIVKDYGATPDRKELIKALSAELKTSEKNILLDKINQQFGKKESVCYVKVYETEEVKKKHEPEYKIKKSGESAPESGLAEIAAETQPTTQEKEAAEKIKGEKE